MPAPLSPGLAQRTAACCCPSRGWAAPLCPTAAPPPAAAPVMGRRARAAPRCACCARPWPTQSSSTTAPQVCGCCWLLHHATLAFASARVSLAFVGWHDLQPLPARAPTGPSPPPSPSSCCSRGRRRAAGGAPRPRPGPLLALRPGHPHRLHRAGRGAAAEWVGSLSRGEAGPPAPSHWPQAPPRPLPTPTCTPAEQA